MYNINEIMEQIMNNDYSLNWFFEDFATREDAYKTADATRDNLISMINKAHKNIINEIDQYFDNKNAEAAKNEKTETAKQKVEEAKKAYMAALDELSTITGIKNDACTCNCVHPCSKEKSINWDWSAKPFIDILNDFLTK